MAAWSAHIRQHDASPGDVVQAAGRALREAGMKATRSRGAAPAVLAMDVGEARASVDTTA